MTTPYDSGIEPGLYRPVFVEGMSKGGRRLHVVAEPKERDALAGQLGLLRLDRLEADIQVTPAEKWHFFRVTASLEADVVQTCVVTLEPVASTVKATLERYYSTDIAGESEDLTAAGVVDLEHDEADPPDPIFDQTIDVGAAVVEQLALEIDPFPRAAGANFEGYSSHPEIEGPANPFAALAKVKEGSSGRNR